MCASDSGMASAAFSCSAWSRSRTKSAFTKPGRWSRKPRRKSVTASHVFSVTILFHTRHHFWFASERMLVCFFKEVGRKRVIDTVPSINLFFSGPWLVLSFLFRVVCCWLVVCPHAFLRIPSVLSWPDGHKLIVARHQPR